MKEILFIVSFVEEDLNPIHAEDLKGSLALAITKEFGLEQEISFNVEDLE